MPFTPYHFGPSGFIALALRKWIDVPVFILANIVVDIEVLVVGFLQLGYPVHRYCHTLIGGAAVGAVWGLAAYLILRRPFQLLMNLLRVRYKPGLVKMIVSGGLGAAFHVLIDGVYHYDVQAFWPSKVNLRRLTHYVEKERIETVCLYFAVAAVIVYINAVISYIKQNKIANEKNSE